MQKKIRKEGSTRLTLLQEMGLWDEVNRLWDEGTACFTKPMEMFGEITGVTFTFNEEPSLKELKERIEQEREAIVYYGIYTETIVGRLVDFFLIGQNEEEWEQEQSMLKAGFADVYCYNLDEQFGEYGSIGFQMANGGLIRRE